MRRAEKEDADNIESNVFNIVKEVRVYFNEVISVKDFVIAVDETGVFFFTTMQNHNQILVKLSNYMDQLDLSRDEVVACCISNNAAQVKNDTFFKKVQDTNLNSVLITEIRPNCFEENIRLLLSSREPVLSKEDVIDIVECFKPSAARAGCLYNYLVEKGFDLDRAKVDEIEEFPALSLQNVIFAFGKGQAEEIFDAITEYRNDKLSAEGKGEIDSTDLISDDWEKSSNNTMVLGVLLVIASIAMYVVKLPVLGLIFAFMGILQARHLALIYKQAAATVITWFSLASTIFGILQIVALFRADLITWLQDTLLIGR